jgi:hypothetical protein
VNHGFSIVLVLAVAGSACVGRVIESRPTPGVPSGVPAVYQPAYSEIAGELDRQLPVLGVSTPKTSTAFGVELVPASSNRGTDLLQEQTPHAVALTLDRLQSLGVNLVTLSLQYPVLNRATPRSADYREFYRRVAGDVRARGLKLVVEMRTAPREPELGKLGDIRGVKREALLGGLRAMAETVIADLQPDFLTVLTEPDTLARDTGLSFSPAEFARAAAQIVRELPHPGVRLGAGAGAWSSSEYVKALAALPELDYLDLHIFPVQHGLAADRLAKAADIARSKGKRVSIGQAWLYKGAARELRTISPVEALGRDALEFWQPLDQNFIRLVVELAQRVDAEFCSFVGMKYLFAYLPLTMDTARMTAPELMQASDRAAADTIRAGRLSATGEVLKRLMGP